VKRNDLAQFAFQIVPNLIPKSLEVPVLVASRQQRAMLAPDRSWTVLLDVRITESRSGWLSKPLLAIRQGRFDLGSRRQ
jgi:hypothetical protein